MYIYIHLLAIRSFFVPKLPLTYWRRWMFIIHHVTGTRLPSVSFQLTRVLWDNFLIAWISEHYKRELDILQRIYVYPLSIQKKTYQDIFGPFILKSNGFNLFMLSKKIIWYNPHEIIRRNTLCLLMNSPWNWSFYILLHYIKIDLVWS